jgi:two-component system chemotaxis response regulator CheB
MPQPIRVLIVDDSALVREVLTEQLSRQPGIAVVGTAPDPFVARERIVALEPDVITLDIEMPRMDGLSFLKKLMKFHPVPTIIFSSIAGRGTHIAMECLEAGAVEVLAKPQGNAGIQQVAARLGEIIRGIKDVTLRADTPRAAGEPARQSPASAGPGGPSNRLIAIGASTGGTDALRDVLVPLPTDLPGIVIVQHMPAGFTHAFANRLNGLCQIEVREACDGDPIRTGAALLAPGDLQMKVVRAAEGWKVRVFDGPRVCRHKPSVDVLFESTAECVGKKAMGVILTGMGGDGSRGMLSMKSTGAYTVAQDKDSCVVFGMPREAIEAGGVCEIAPLSRIPGHILDWSRGASRLAA